VRGRSAPHDLLRAARAKADAARADAQRKAIADAQKIVAIWNARQAGGRLLWFYPTIGAAIAAGLPWLTVQRHQTRVTGVLPAMLHLKFPA
jgi:hypothetical protein